MKHINQIGGRAEGDCGPFICHQSTDPEVSVDQRGEKI